MKIIMSVFMMFVFLAGQALADESVCDGQVGRAYGLCNAYCEAMNCDDPDLQKASDKACQAVKANYQKLMGADQVFPCEETVPSEEAVSSDEVDCAWEWTDNRYDLPVQWASCWEDTGNQAGQENTIYFGSYEENSVSYPGDFLVLFETWSGDGCTPLEADTECFSVLYYAIDMTGKTDIFGFQITESEYDGYSSDYGEMFP